MEGNSRKMQWKEWGSHAACALTNVCSVLAGENGAQLQVQRNIKTQLGTDMELVMQKSEDRRRRRRSGVRRRRRRRRRRRQRRRRTRQREKEKVRYLGGRQSNAKDHNCILQDMIRGEVGGKKNHLGGVRWCCLPHELSFLCVQVL